MENREQLIQTAITAAIKAGEVIMEVYDGPFHIESKDDKSPLTEADLKANVIINNFLKPLGLPIISEENKQIDYADRKDWEVCWIVDPLDGTKEFIKRNGEFTVNIALVSKGSPLLGVIYVPVSKTLFFADVDKQKAFKVVLKDHEASIEDVLGEAVQIRYEKPQDDTVRVVGSRSHMNQDTLDFIEGIKTEGYDIEIVSRGSSLKFCLVAEGKADVYPRYAPTMEWDTAAGQAICNAAGVDVISRETNSDLNYNKENLLNPFFLVRGKTTELKS